jgi:hypothetical protein
MEGSAEGWEKVEGWFSLQVRLAVKEMQQSRSEESPSRRQDGEGAGSRGRGGIVKEAASYLGRERERLTIQGREGTGREVTGYIGEGVRPCWSERRLAGNSTLFFFL